MESKAEFRDTPCICELAVGNNTAGKSLYQLEIPERLYLDRKFLNPSIVVVMNMEHLRLLRTGRNEDPRHRRRGSGRGRIESWNDHKDGSVMERCFLNDRLESCAANSCSHTIYMLCSPCHQRIFLHDARPAVVCCSIVLTPISLIKCCLRMRHCSLMESRISTVSVCG
jgi:hypothetical protein